MFDTSRAACNRGRGAQYAPAPTRLQVHGDGADLLDCRVKKLICINIQQISTRYRCSMLMSQQMLFFFHPRNKKKLQQRKTPFSGRCLNIFFAIRCKLILLT